MRLDSFFSFHYNKIAYVRHSSFFCPCAGAFPSRLVIAASLPAAGVFLNAPAGRSSPQCQYRREVQRNASDLSAQEEAEEKGPRFPSEDEDAQRPQRHPPPPRQGPQVPDRVTHGGMLRVGPWITNHHKGCRAGVCSAPPVPSVPLSFF